MVSSVQVPPDATGGKKVHTVESVIDTETVQTQVMILSDGTNQSNRQIIDDEGAAFTRFPTGSPNFDAFALMLTSEPNLMGTYKFYEGDEVEKFHKHEIGGATIGTDATMGSLKLTTGTADGDEAHYFTNRRFADRPGASLNLMVSMKIGDAGKVNVLREVGWFGDNNERIGFEVDGLNIYVSTHSNLTGVTTRVAIANWNGDRLDGSGGEFNRSGETVDPLKANLWWIDYQFMGAIRFGAWINGKQVVCHTMEGYNAHDRPFLQSPTLAFGVKQENVGVVGSSSEFHVFMAAITGSGYPEHAVRPTGVVVNKTINSDSFTPIVSVRCSELLGSLGNRQRLMPLVINSISTAQPVELKAELNSTLTGETWAGTAYGIEYDDAATSSTPVPGLDPALGAYIGVNVPLVMDLTALFPTYADGFHRDWDITTANHMTISVRLLEPGTTLFGMNVSMELRQ